MNEQIRKLADEARIKPMGSSWTYRPSDEFEEKFADMIVQECRDIVEQDMKLAHIQMIPLTLEKYANGRLKEKIREHFGVEE